MRPRVLLLLATLALWAPWAGATDTAPVLEAAPADPALLERIYTEQGIVVGERSQGPLAYVTDAVTTLGSALAKRLERLLALAAGSSSWWGRIALALLALVLVLLLVWVAVLLVRALGRRHRRPAPVEPRLAPAAVVLDLDALAWKRELTARLAAGDLDGALEAAWWWLARTLGGAGVDPAWTSGELLRAVGRRELSPVVRRLDAMIYGPSAPRREAVEGLVRELERALTA